MLKFMCFCVFGLFLFGDLNAASDSCPCNPNNIWLDLIFVVESTDGVSKESVGQIENFIKTALEKTTISPEHLRVGLIAYSSEISVVADLTTYGSTSEFFDNMKVPFLGGSTNDAESALRKATELFQKDHRANVRKVAVLFAASLDTIQSAPIEIGNDFREDGGVLIGIEFVSSHGARVPGIFELASEGYILTNFEEELHADDLVAAFCDANCYCAPGHFSMTNGTRKTPDGGCFLSSDVAAGRDQASQACQNVHPNAHLAVVPDAKTNDILFSMNKWTVDEQWLGAHFENDHVVWDGNIQPQSTTFQPTIHKSTTKGNCLTARQIQSQKVEWYVSDCNTPQKFVCQSAPFSSGNRVQVKPHSKYRKLDTSYLN